MAINRKNLQDYKGILIRPESMDSYVVDEVPNCYKLLELGPRDRVMDVGANIGVFCRMATEMGVASITGYEPFPDNFELAKLNAPKADLRRAALISGKQVTVDFYVNVRGKNHGAHSSVPTRGREVITVPAMNWQAELKYARPTKIKMDCEGAEYDLLQAPLPTYVKRIALELHLQKTSHREAAPILHESLLAQGFTALKDPTPSFSTKAWHAIGVYGRS